MQTQNLLLARACGFKSHCRQAENTGCFPRIGRAAGFYFAHFYFARAVIGTTRGQVCLSVDGKRLPAYTYG